MGMSVFVTDDLLPSVSHSILIPLVLTEEFLQRPDGHSRLPRHCFDVLAFDVRELSTDVRHQRRSRVASGKTVTEPMQRVIPLGLPFPNRRGIPASSSLECDRQKSSRTTAQIAVSFISSSTGIST